MTRIETYSPADAFDVPRFPIFVAMMASLMALTALSIDIMLPAFPQISDEYALSDINSAQLVVTLYVVGFAIGQIFVGPLSDRFGRKPVLIGGLLVYALASIVCLVAHRFDLLLAARFIQGAANAAPRVITIAVVRDIYGGRRMAEVMSFVMMVFIIVPVIAPLLGAGLLRLGSWQLIFAFLFVFSIGVLVWMALALPETRPPESREPLSARWLVGAFGETLRNRATLGYTLATGSVFGALMGYINASQQVFTGIYDAGAWFPVLFGAVSAALAVAALLNSQFVMRLGMRRISHAALLGFVAISCFHAAIAWNLGPPAALALRRSARARSVLLRPDHAELQFHRDGADGPDRRHRLVLRRRGHDRPRGIPRLDDGASLRRHGHAALAGLCGLRPDGPVFRSDRRARQAVRAGCRLVVEP